MRNQKSKKISSERGFTLTETIVALAIIIAAAVGPVYLVTRGLLNFSSAKNKLTAANLAQEGIELVRAVRDNNIICDQQNGPPSWDWNRDPDGGNLTNTTREPDVSQTVVISCGASSITTPRLPIYIGQSLRRNSATGIYGYVGDIVTSFTRKVDIRVPAQNPDAGIPSSEQMDIVSTVEWKEGVTAKSVILRERLYNWK